MTLLAASVQAVRTAAQKYLAGHMSVWSATLVRFLFGLPFAAAYLLLLERWFGAGLPTLHPRFLLLCAAASVSQIAATVLLVHLFSLRNFAVGTTYARTEVLLTALLGAALFGEVVTAAGWIAMLIGVAGLILINLGRTGLEGGTLIARAWNRSAAVGVGAGLGFALASLLIREASLSLGEGHFLLRAGVTLLVMVVMQTAMLGLWIAATEPGQFALIARKWRAGTLVGLTSAAGSAGWFTAMTIERASYVKALGQVETLFALGISYLFFRERSNRKELLGMALVVAGIVLLLAYA